jgi:hypothetical protein
MDCMAYQPDALPAGCLAGQPAGVRPDLTPDSSQVGEAGGRSLFTVDSRK